jgi:hypothetical protein
MQKLAGLTCSSRWSGVVVALPLLLLATFQKAREKGVLLAASKSMCRWIDGGLGLELVWSPTEAISRLLVLRTVAVCLIYTVASVAWRIMLAKYGSCHNLIPLRLILFVTIVILLNTVS